MADRVSAIVPFRFCPACASDQLETTEGKAIRCNDCGFVYFHNSAAAAGVVIRHQDEILLIERGRNPARGLLDVPGGFVDYDESADRAALRETREETGIELDEVRYLASFSNHYEYRGVLYRICDVYFEARVTDKPTAIASDDAAAIVWRRPEKVAADEVAFDSVRSLLQLLSGTPTA